MNEEPIELPDKLRPTPIPAQSLRPFEDMKDETKATIRELLEQGMDAKESYEQLKEGFNTIPNPSAYGNAVSRWVPDYEYVHNLLLRTIRPYIGGSAKILDAGAGSGRLSKLILETFQNCHITLLDVSESLLSAVPDKLKAFPGQYEIVHGDFFDPAVEFPAASFDCIVSAFAICHGRKETGYQNLYQRFHKWLKPECCFICLDHVYGPTTELNELGFEDWGEILERSFGEERAAGIIKNAIQEDSPLTVSRHLDLLSESGFDAVDILWKKNVFALYAGMKIRQQE